jgi:hypothetical protein
MDDVSKCRGRVLVRVLTQVLGVALAGTLFCASAAAVPVYGVSSEEFIVEPATLQSLGFEWYIKGDENRNATVEVSYRKKGEQQWRMAQPLFRLQHEKIKELAEFVAPNAFVGSIFDLQPGTEYECRFLLKDPDGVRGVAQKIVSVRTRAEPVPATGGHTYHVYPYENPGPYQAPAYFGILAAFFANDLIGGDHYNVYPPRVEPGDIILVHAGVYKETREYYATLSIAAGGKNMFGTGCCGATWDGTYYLTASGTAEKPIVIKAAGDGEVIFDGADNHTLFNVMGGNFLYFEGITFRNTDVAIEAGLKSIAGSQGLTVKHCRFDHVGVGIHTDWSGSKNFYIADNEFIGKADPNVLVPFSLRPPFDKVPGIRKEQTQDLSQFAVKVYGSGNVVAFNRVRFFHDGIDFATYGLPDGYPKIIRDRAPVSNDFYNNDISLVHDDCIESDGALYNMRVMHNLCGNMAGSGLSMQPIWGLVYFIRNIVYHDPGNFGALKLTVPTAAVFYHNTLLAAVRGSGPMGGGANLQFRNNLILAEDPSDPAFNISSFTNFSSSDYNGFMSGQQAAFAFGWNSPKFGDLSTDHGGNLEKRSYPTLADYVQATHQDTHSVMVGYEIFANLQPAPASDPTHVYDIDSLNFGLAPGGAAIDRGIVLPNINDDFSGAAPDLGAVEFGRPPTHYGPRP